MSEGHRIPNLTTSKAILIIVAAALIAIGYNISVTNYDHQALTQLISNQGNLSNTQRQTLIKEFTAISDHGGLATQDNQQDLVKNVTNIVSQLKNVGAQNGLLLKEIVAEQEKLLELQPLLFNDLSTNITNSSSIIQPAKTYFLTDARFSDEGWGKQGLSGAKSINATAIDGIPITDIVHSLIIHAAKNPRLIIAQGFQWGDPVLKISHLYPHTKFVVMTGLVQGKNVASIYPEQQQGSFLLGAIGAMMSKSHIIGFVGGQEYPNIVNIMEGYKQGARYIDPKIQVLTDWTFDFNNITKGRIIANEQINQGADFLLHVADTSGQGVIQAANQRNVTALGAVADQNHTLTSFVVDMKKAYGNTMNDIGIIRPGLETHEGAPGPGIIFLAPFHSPVPQAVQNKVSELTNDIMTGKIVVPERSVPTP